jgi:hypothetical protein
MSVHNCVNDKQLSQSQMLMESNIQLLCVGQQFIVPSRVTKGMNW